MRAKVQWLHSPDTEPDEYAPPDPKDSTIFLQVMVDEAQPPEDRPEGGEAFNLEVFTPVALAQRVRSGGPRIGRHLVIVDRWDYATVAQFLTHAFESEEGADWDEVGNRLNRFGRWEFEDYDEARDSWQVPSGVGAHVTGMTAAGTDLERFRPGDPTDFRVPVDVTIAAVKGAREGTFTVEVCTSRALTRRAQSEGIFLGEYLLIVERWDAAAIATKLTEIFESQDGATWEELAGRLARYGRRLS